MNLKSVLIPIAAFAVTVTGASAFSSDVLVKAGLSDEQVAAFEEAKELRESGDKEAARNVLEEAGIDESVMEKLRDIMKEKHSAVKAAVEKNDFAAFKVAVADSPLAEIIDTEAEFAKFVEAHTLMKNGNGDEAKTIFDDLGLKRPEGHGPMNGEGKEPPFFDHLTDEQKAEVKAAFEARDHDKVKDLLESYGIELPEKAEGRGFGFGHGMKDGDRE